MDRLVILFFFAYDAAIFMMIVNYYTDDNIDIRVSMYVLGLASMITLGTIAAFESRNVMPKVHAHNAFGACRFRPSCTLRWGLIRVTVLFASMIVASGCQPSTSQTNSSLDGGENQSVRTRELAKMFFEHYARRDDWDGFLDLYDPDMRFEDQRVNVATQGRKAFADFYNWPDERFQKAKVGEPILVINQLLVDGQTAVARGSFAPFRWEGKLWEFPDEFVIWLTFNDQGKIIYQRDYISYPKWALPDEPAPE